MLRGTPRRSGFTLVELLVVVAIIAVLAGITFPVFSQAQEKARTATCTSNQRQLALAITMYAQDWQAYPSIDWFGTVDKAAQQLVKCPSNPDIPVGVGINGFLHNARPGSITNAANAVAVCDAQYSSTIEPDYGRHRNGCMVTCLDGHGQFVKSNEELEKFSLRFAVGKFPVVPIVVKDGAEMPEVVMSFYEGKFFDGTDNKDNYLIAGPYGQDQQSALTGVRMDYIGEGQLAGLGAESAPQKGMAAPHLEKIAPAAGNSITNWFKLPTTTNSMVSLNGTDVYNADNPGLTTYAVVYVYMPQAVTLDDTHTVDWWCDDLGKIWLNGTLFAMEANSTDQGAVDPGTPTTSIKSGTIPKGLNYFLIKTTNNSAQTGTTDPQPAGGMKFKLKFNLGGPVYVSTAL